MPTRLNFYFFLVLFSGIAALSWQVIWQIRTALALGVSAQGTALTIAVTMGGMSLGSYLMGRWLDRRVFTTPIRLYGLLEGLIGLAGLCIIPAFALVETLDSQFHAALPAAGSLLHIAGLVTIIGIPTLCMGATIPVFALLARQHQLSLATLYSLNTLGAALGTILVAFLFIPVLGMEQTGWLIASINLLVAVLCLLPQSVTAPNLLTTDISIKAEGDHPATPWRSLLLVTATGFATFLLEVSWFRSLTAAFYSTTEAFALMLAALLLALGIGAWLAPLLRGKSIGLPVYLGCSGLLVLLVTPLIERFDQIFPLFVQPDLLLLSRFMMTFFVIGPPVALLGLALPWIAEEQRHPRQVSLVYACNTLASIAGAILAAWVLLPTIGFAKTSWLAGSLLLLVAIVSTNVARQRLIASGVLTAGLLIAFLGESGVGRNRMLGWLDYGAGWPTKLLGFYEGPESTIAAVEFSNGGRALVIDGFFAASQLKGEVHDALDSYMAWMGHVPMLLHPNPQQALVICFGTGQTSNAVRKENPVNLDIVDINPRVFKLAPYFDKNEGVLKDQRVHPIVMDGRAYLRRTPKQYDIITLEPMPPSFAGVNALYSKEFYELARSKLTAQGIVAQWVPFHAMAPKYGAAVIRTFTAVFPNAVLWVDPSSKTGILLGSVDVTYPLGPQWPGLERNVIERQYSPEQIRNAVRLDREGLKAFDAVGQVITDDNQLLAYGEAVHLTHFFRYTTEQTLDLINSAQKP